MCSLYPLAFVLLPRIGFPWGSPPVPSQMKLGLSQETFPQADEVLPWLPQCCIRTSLCICLIRQYVSQKQGLCLFMPVSLVTRTVA